jgi:hypothetical protein
MERINQRFGLALQSYEDIHGFSISRPESFWNELWDFCEVKAEAKGTRVLADAGHGVRLAGGHGDRGGRRPDLGPAALPGRHGLADSVISACAAHITHPAVAYSKIPARTLWASYEPGRLTTRSGGRGYPGNMTGT